MKVKEPTPTRSKEGCEFTTTQEHLYRALRALSGIAGKNPALPILSNVLIKSEQGQLRMSTTDLEVGVTVWVPGKLRGTGALTAPLRPLAEYVQNLSTGPLTLQLNRGALAVAAERAHATFQGESAENFPLIPHLAEGIDLPLPPVVARALDAVLYAMATEETRPELAGVLVHAEGKTLTLAATDSYRLAEVSVPLPTAPSSPVRVILPARGAQEFRRALDGVDDVTLRVGEQQLLLHAPTLEVVSRRIEGSYPDYTQIIPKRQPTNAEVDRATLLRAIRASAVFSGTAVSRVTLEVRSDVLRVAATTPEMGETETILPAEVTGETTTIAFNERFLRDALGSFSTDRVRLGLGTAATPAMLHPVAPEEQKENSARVAVLALVMPVKT